MSEQDDYLDDSGEQTQQTAQGTKALLIAILGQAVSDMRGKKDPKESWPERRLAGARWILGIGSESRGISVHDVASAIDMTAEQIQEAVKAQDFAEEFIAKEASKKKKPVIRQVDSDSDGGDGEFSEVEFEVLECFKNHEW